MWTLSTLNDLKIMHGRLSAPTMHPITYYFSTLHAVLIFAHSIVSIKVLITRKDKINQMLEILSLSPPYLMGESRVVN